VKVAVIGSAGQLGIEVSRAFSIAGHDVSPLTHAEIEVTEPQSVRKALFSKRPDVVVNCAAYVRVDDAEDDPDSAFRVNALGALHVARLCADLNALCIFISTDYVFNGEKTEPYTEQDYCLPISVYGAAKLAGEHLVQQGCPNWLIVRVSSLFGKSGARAKGGNFIETIVAQAKKGVPLRVVNDTRISPTYAADAAAAIVELAQRATAGIIHLTNSGFCTWYELAKKVTELCRLEAVLEPVSSSTFPKRAARPRNSALSNALAAETIGKPFPDWEDALLRYLRCKGHVE
jgi:dTDP-4-dehydrorhamnose reductase